MCADSPSFRRAMPPPIPQGIRTPPSPKGTQPPPIPNTAFNESATSVPSGGIAPPPIPGKRKTPDHGESPQTGELPSIPTLKCGKRGSHNKVVLYIAGGLLIALGIGSAARWHYREPIRLALYPWLNDPSSELVSTAVFPQLDGLASRADRIEVTLLDSAIKHKRGTKTATWTGHARVTLSDSRYVPVGPDDAAKEAGLDIDALGKAIKIYRSLPADQAPDNGIEDPPLLAKKVADTGQVATLLIHGSVTLAGDSWTVTLDNRQDVEAKVAEFRTGQSLKEIGPNAIDSETPEAHKAMAAFVARCNRFIGEVKAAQIRVEQQRREDEGRQKRVLAERGRGQMEQKAADEKAAAGIVQASWYALERLSKYLVNVEINQRLIDLAEQRGDSSRANLYRSYAQANDDNIRDAIASYAQGVKDLSKLDSAAKEKAIQSFKDTLPASSPPWMTRLVEQMEADATSLPDFNGTAWRNHIRQIRQAAQQTTQPATP